MEPYFKKSEGKLFLNLEFYKTQTNNFKNKNEDMFMYAMIQMVRLSCPLAENIKDTLQQCKEKIQKR